MICRRISPGTYPWNQRVACPEISCNMQAPHLLFKPKIFSQVFDTSSLGTKPTSWAAQLPGSWLQHWVTPRKRPPREPAKTVHHPTLAIGNPAAAIQWDPSSWETAPTFPQLREPACSEPEAVGNLPWAPAERAQNSEGSIPTCRSSDPLYKTHHEGCTGSSDPMSVIPWDGHQYF